MKGVVVTHKFPKHIGIQSFPPERPYSDELSLYGEVDRASNYQNHRALWTFGTVRQIENELSPGCLAYNSQEVED